MKQFEQEKNPFEAADQAVEKKSKDKATPDSGRKEGFFDRVRNKAREVHQNFKNSIDGMKKSMDERSSGKFEEESQQFKNELDPIVHEGEEATEKFESDLEKANDENDAGAVRAEEKDGMAEKKEDPKERALQMAKQLAEKRHRITEEILSKRNEDNSVNLGDFSLSQDEAEELLNKSARMKDEIIGYVYREIGGMGEKDLEEVISGLESENNSLSQESISENIKDTVVEKRAHNRIKELRTDTMKSVREVENKLGEAVAKLIKSGKMGNAMEMRGFEREINLLRGKIESAPIGSVQISGREGLQKQSNKSLEKSERMAAKLNEIVGALDLLDKAGEEEFGNLSRKIKDSLEDINSLG